MPVDLPKKNELIGLLNEALGWELRAHALYAHYAAYVKGLESLTLAEHFKEEATESTGHAETVRTMIADLGGEAVTARDSAKIVHTEETKVMLEEGLKTEKKAAETYQQILPLVKGYDPFYHDIRHILLDELNAVVEFETLMGK